MPGEKITLTVIRNNAPVKNELFITTKRARNFTMAPIAKPDLIQKSILDKWCNDKGVPIKKSDANFVADPVENLAPLHR